MGWEALQTQTATSRYGRLTYTAESRSRYDLRSISLSWCYCQLRFCPCEASSLRTGMVSHLSVIETSNPHRWCLHLIVVVGFECS
jgi:hypothetical protein